MSEKAHNPPREATEEEIEGDQRERRDSEPAEGGYGAEQEDPRVVDDSRPEKG